MSQIEEPTRTREIKNATQEGLHPHGMMTFDQSLAGLVKGLGQRAEVLDAWRRRFQHRSTRQ